MTILSVDDDQDIHIVLEQYLDDAGYRFLSAKNLEQAIDVLRNNKVTVVLLDLTLPDGEGLSLIPQIKTETEAGIIIVSGKNDTTEKVVCLEMGADDYITKPFELRELSARIKAVIRRMQDKKPSAAGPAEEDEVEDKLYFNDGWCFDRSHYQLYKPDGKSADLTSGEFSLLDALIKSANRALSREQIFERTRSDGGYENFDRSIDIQIARLRKKINDNDANTPIIKTVRGVGYMFSLPLKQKA